MFKIIRNNKNLYYYLIRNNFLDSFNNIDTWGKPENFDWNELSDLKTLRIALEDKNINHEEAIMIIENIKQIDWEAEEWLKELAEKILENWFSAIDKNYYEKIYLLMQKKSINIPSWSKIEESLLKNLSILSSWNYKLGKVDKDEDFHGIEVNKNKVSVRYDWVWINDTLEINYDKEGEITGTNWVNNRKEHENLRNNTKIESDLLDDNIRKVEKKGVSQNDLWEEGAKEWIPIKWYYVNDDGEPVDQDYNPINIDDDGNLTNVDGKAIDPRGNLLTPDNKKTPKNKEEKITNEQNTSSLKTVNLEFTEIKNTLYPKNYEVKKGETLWKIVKNHYKIKDNTKIAKMVNFVVDSQKDSKMAKRLWKDENPKNFRDGIKWDKLWVWDKIVLPKIPKTIKNIKKSSTWVRKKINR